MNCHEMEYTYDMLGFRDHNEQEAGRCTLLGEHRTDADADSYADADAGAGSIEIHNVM